MCWHGNVSFEAQISALISDVLWHRKSTSLRWSDDSPGSVSGVPVNNSAVEQRRSSLGAGLMPRSTHSSSSSVLTSSVYRIFRLDHWLGGGSCAVKL